MKIINQSFYHFCLPNHTVMGAVPGQILRYVKHKQISNQMSNKHITSYMFPSDSFPFQVTIVLCISIEKRAIQGVPKKFINIILNDNY